MYIQDTQEVHNIYSSSVTELGGAYLPPPLYPLFEPIF